MRNNSRFGSKGVFTCTCCGRATRETGDGVDHMCHQCFEIAGLDNQVNDDGLSPCPADILAICNDHLDRIGKLGGNVEAVKAVNDFIWGKTEITVAPVIDTAEEATTEVVITVQPTKQRRLKMSKRSLTKAQKTVNLVAKFDGKIKPGELVAKIKSMCQFETERAARTYLHNARKALKAGKATVTPARKRSKKAVDQAAA